MNFLLFQYEGGCSSVKELGQVQYGEMGGMVRRTPEQVAS